MEEPQSDINWKARAESVEEELAQREKQHRDTRTKLQEREAECETLARRLTETQVQGDRIDQALNAARATIAREVSARERSEAALLKQIAITDNLRLELKLLSSKVARLLEERVALITNGSQGNTNASQDTGTPTSSVVVQDDSPLRLDLYEFLAESDPLPDDVDNMPEVSTPLGENGTDQDLPVPPATSEISSTSAKSRLRAMISKRFGGGSLQGQDDFQQALTSLSELQPTRHAVRVFAGPSVDRLRQVATSSSESSHVPAPLRGSLWESSVGNRLRLSQDYFDRLCKRRDALRSHIAEKELAESGSTIAPTPNGSQISTKADCAERRSVEKGLQVCSHLTAEEKLETVEFGPECFQDFELIKKGMQQISLDLNRTFQARDLAGFQMENAVPLQDRLRDVLETFLVSQPEFGYTQGMSFIAALMLLHMNAMQAFVCFSNAILLQPWLTACYSFDMVVIRRYFEIFNEVLIACVPKVGLHFQALGLQAEVFLVEWWFTLFARSLPLPIVVRLWDMFFLEGDFLLYKASVAIVQYFSEPLLSRSRDECLAVLSSWPSQHLELVSFFETFGKVTLTEKKLIAASSKVRRRAQQPSPEEGGETSKRRLSLVGRR